MSPPQRILTLAASYFRSTMCSIFGPDTPAAEPDSKGAVRAISAGTERSRQRAQALAHRRDRSRNRPAPPWPRASRRRSSGLRVEVPIPVGEDGLVLHLVAVRGVDDEAAPACADLVHRAHVPGAGVRVERALEQRAAALVGVPRYSNQNSPRYCLFLSSQSIGSHSSTLLLSGSRIQANFPFSCDSGPL